MTTARLFHVDAFATAPFAGNPASVLVLPAEPGDDFCHRIGAELGQPVTAVAWPGEPGRFGLRWLTAHGELALCGHGTLAAARVLLDAGHAVDGGLRFDTRAGRLDAEAAGDWVQLRFPGLPPAPLADRALSAAVRDLIAAPVTDVLRNDLDAMAVLGSAAEVRSARPDLAALARLPFRGLIITAVSNDDAADFVSRFFSPATGTGEDAVTGSAHCALGPYWAGLGRQPLLGRQLSARGGLVRVAQDGTGVLLAGPALVLSAGSWLIPPGGEGPR